MPKKKYVFQHVGVTPIIPISFKILSIFICLLLLSNFTTNYITVRLSGRQIITLTNTVLVSELKDLYTAAGNQYQIYSFSHDKEASVQAIKAVASRSFSESHSLALAFNRNGELLFSVTAAGNDPAAVLKQFPDPDGLALLNAQYDAGVTDGSLNFTSSKEQYFGVYKYQPDWDCYFVRAELRSDTQRSIWHVFGIISLIIMALVLVFLIIGFLMFRRIFTTIRRITDSLYRMQEDQQLETIDLSGAVNDDVTYLAASFNALSSTINNLLGIFQKFVSKDVVAKAYNEHTIRLEGSQRNLTILFSDIKGFTYRTETLGNDIIDLLNVHYDRVIHSVHENGGVVGSIIGDAILAIYGTDNPGNVKSLQAVQSAWDCTRLTAALRGKMKERRQEIEKIRPLTEAEERVYEAVLIDVGVGIDGGTVFYGNIGSSEHMANTVIGDNVNASSRLEGLTRVYQLPVITSEYIKKETESATNRYHFYEIDTVQVKGKTEGMKIYFPLDTEASEDGLSGQFDLFEQGLELYYSGDWKKARSVFKQCSLDTAGVFIDRMGNKQTPADWSGIWTMTSK